MKKLSKKDERKKRAFVYAGKHNGKDCVLDVEVNDYGVKVNGVYEVGNKNDCGNQLADEAIELDL